MITNGIFSQDNRGYYDSKFYATVITVGNMPLLYNLIAKSESTKMDLLNYGFRISGGYILKRNIGLCLELGLDYGNFKNQTIHSYNNSSYYNTYTIYDNLKTQTLSIMPKIEFTNANGLLPLGLTHQLGFGFSETSIIPGVYSAISNVKDSTLYSDGYYTYYNYSYHLVKSENKMEKTPENIIHTKTIMYALNLRKAITKKIMISYGFRYTLNFSKYNINAIPQGKTYNDVYFSGSIPEIIKKRSFYNFINFNIGLTYVFCK